jgi:hypothetical protein
MVRARVKVKEKLVSSGALRGFEMVGLGVVARTLLTGNPEDATASSSSSNSGAGAGVGNAPASGTGTAEAGGGNSTDVALHNDSDGSAAIETVEPTAAAAAAVSSVSGGLFASEVAGAVHSHLALSPIPSTPSPLPMVRVFPREHQDVPVLAS